jgi:hypothetical protein
VRMCLFLHLGVHLLQYFVLRFSERCNSRGTVLPARSALWRDRAAARFVCIGVA